MTFDPPFYCIPDSTACKSKESTCSAYANKQFVLSKAIKQYNVGYVNPAVTNSHFQISVGGTMANQQVICIQQPEWFAPTPEHM